jgi:uncharacterized membrane protein YbhN (UPF0104 family)
MYWLILGIILYNINYVLRGYRLKYILNNNVKISQALYLCSTHGMYSYFLPGRTGDASLPVMLKTNKITDWKNSLYVLLKTRILDISTLGLFIILSGLFMQDYIYRNLKITMILIGIPMVLLLYMWEFLLKNKYIIKFAPTDIFLINKPALQEITYSIIIWIFIYLSQYCTVKSINLNISIFEIILLSTIQLPLQFIPVQGIANTGNHESAWVITLSILGYSKTDAINYAISSHIVTMIYVISLLIMSLSASKIKSSKR